MGLLATYYEARALGCVLAKGDGGKEDRENYEIDRSYQDPCRGWGENPRPCQKFDNGRCCCYQRYHTLGIAAAKGRKLAESHRAMPQHHGKVKAEMSALTVAQLAKKLGVSKNEVRRRKSRGELQ